MKIIFIAGYGHVGSSILEFYLNKHSEIFALGETKHLKYSKNKICTCKKKLNNCNFWKKIVKKRFYTLEGFVDHKISRFKYFMRLILINFEKKKINPYKILSSNIKKKKIKYLVDNSKDPLALIDCIRKNKKNEVLVIFLKREILNVIKSYSNNERKLKKLDLKNPIITFIEYFINNLLISIILKIYNIKYINIKNYELKYAPSKTLKKIFNFFKINNNSYNLKKINTPYHSMEGNILRLKLGNLPNF